MNNAQPLISIGMPVLDCATTVGTAIRSILNQTYTNWELLLLDDGSSDRTLEVVHSFSDRRVRVWADGLHLGLVKRLNQAIELSQGKYFARMDGDDIAYPERLEQQVKFLEENPEIDLLGCGVLVFKADGYALGSRAVWEKHEEICRRPWAGFYLAHPTWMGRTEWFRKHRYREEAVRTEDQDLLLRTYKLSRFASLSDVLLGYREDSIYLSRILLGRYSYCRSLVREARQTKKYFFALRGITGHAAKAVLDTVAVLTGLNYRILKHRAGQVDSQALLRWANVWAEVQSPSAAEKHTENPRLTADSPAGRTV